MQQQLRSEMDSRDLLCAVKDQEKLSRSFVACGEQNRLPEYLETMQEKYRKYDGVKDDKVRILDLNVNGLPEGDEKEILRTLFKNQHVIQI